MPDKKEETAAAVTTETANTSATETEAGEAPTGSPIESGITLDQALAQMRELQNKLKDRNREEAARRKKLEALEAEEKKRQEAELTEAQKWQKQAKEYEEKLARYESEMQAGKLRLAAERVAAELNFNKTEEACKLADLSGVTFGENGEPDVKAIRAILEALAKGSSYLLKQPQPKPATIGATEGRAGSQTGLVLEEEDVKKKFHLR